MMGPQQSITIYADCKGIIYYAFSRIRHHSTASPELADGGDALLVVNVAAKIFNRKSEQQQEERTATGRANSNRKSEQQQKERTATGRANSNRKSEQQQEDNGLSSSWGVGRGKYNAQHNQQSAHYCFLDIYNITLNIPTCFGLQGIIIRIEICSNIQ
jgi:hypothetical protein